MYRIISEYTATSGGYNGITRTYKKMSIAYNTKEEAEREAKYIREASSAKVVTVVKDGEE